MWAPPDGRSGRLADMRMAGSRHPPRSGILAWRECSIPGLAPSLAWESGSYAIFIVGGVAMALALGSPPINLYKSVCKRSAGIWTIFHSHGFSFTGSNLWKYCSLDAFNVLQCFANTFLSAFTRRLRLSSGRRESRRAHKNKKGFPILQNEGSDNAQDYLGQKIIA